MKTPLLIAAAALLASCATADPSAQPIEEKRYATGSNIPKRDNVHTMTPEAFEQVKNQSSGNTGRPRGN